ncbi:MAG: hypothetical protein ABSG10_08960 [Terracidiphilus sp.]
MKVKTDPSSGTIIDLWDHLESMEREMRFDGKPYPKGMCQFPFRLTGQGFFPGGDGLWRDDNELGMEKDAILPREGAVFIGNDFGTLNSYLRLRARNYENVPTWRHIKSRVRNAGVPSERTFFTNAILGLREDGSALDKKSWQRMPAFSAFCGEFLRFQLKSIAPKLVVIMGPDASEAFDTFAKGNNKFETLYTTHPYADFGLSKERRSEEIERLSRAWKRAANE